MKNCPKCNSELEDSFEICWNCNYSLADNKVVEFEETADNTKTKNINCIRCNEPLVYAGNFKFHEGTRFGIFGNIFEAFTNRESFDLYACPTCKKVEFYFPEEN